MADKITRLPSDLERRKRDEENYSWFIHKCKNVEYKIYPNNRVYCTKCEEDVGECLEFTANDPPKGFFEKIMGNVFHMEKIKPYEYRCECGSVTFFLRDDWAITCASCRKIVGTYDPET